MQQTLREYIVSERFIHDGLLKDGDFLVKRLYKLWKRDRRIEPSVLMWPSHELTADDGGKIDRLIAMTLPPEIEEHKSQLRAAVDRVSAYAFFIVRREGSEVKALLETPHGTRSWTIPIQRSADVELLGAATVRDDKDWFGLLWVPKRDRS